MRRKTAALEEALDCSFLTRARLPLQLMLSNTGHFTVRIAVLDDRIAFLCQPWERQILQLDAIPASA
jgi:hypothetical protein